MHPKDEKELRFGERVLFCFAGALLACITTYVFAFLACGVPSTSSGVAGVLSLMPIAALCGCIAVLLIIYFVQRRRR